MDFSNKDFVHFHCHSEMSQLDGLCKLSGLVMTARKMGFESLALTDHGNLMGWLEFLRHSTATHDKKGNEIPYPPIKPILGAEFYLSKQVDVGQYDGKRKNEKVKEIQPEGRRGNRHLNLYATNFKGYQNITALSQASFLDGFYFSPRIDIDLLSKHTEGVMCGSACLSSIVNANLAYGSYGNAREACVVLKDLFGENFFLTN